MAGPIEKLMVYLDGTEESLIAAQYAVCLAKSTGASLTAMYVVNTRALNDLLRSRIFIESEEREYKRDLEEDAGRYLNHVKDLARKKGLAIETIKTSGAINSEIKHKVDELDIDLLIIGELSRIQSRRDEFYNEVERAMRSVGCSVLIVKNEDRVWSLYESLV
ncbi:universal stress protein [Oceanispirochaeta sp.]|jgi:nucleotide-binding universal stress UspA family protein|uniref:universal stress protein n=1 Tax=Oceanispirochaeta sp. TaxID=2035350 RepID=UPI002614398D|nr:universal stress protein [Oceanispirochaeta sp.]MDA3958958.1 universal stress protein [Oceanispirochaeta sp.]